MLNHWLAASPSIGNTYVISIGPGPPAEGPGEGGGGAKDFTKPQQTIQSPYIQYKTHEY